MSEAELLSFRTSSYIITIYHTSKLVTRTVLYTLTKPSKQAKLHKSSYQANLPSQATQSRYQANKASQRNKRFTVNNLTAVYTANLGQRLTFVNGTHVLTQLDGPLNDTSSATTHSTWCNSTPKKVNKLTRRSPVKNQHISSHSSTRRATLLQFIYNTLAVSVCY